MTIPTMLLLLLSFESPSGEFVPVYFGTGATQVSRVRTTDLGEPVDLAYDKQTKQLFTLSKMADGYYCIKFSLDGTKLAAWKLTAEQRPICELHSVGGELRTILWRPKEFSLGNSGPIYLAKMPRVATDTLIAEELEDWWKYDEPLSLDRCKPIHKLMVLLEFDPPGGPESAGGPNKSLNFVRVNARSLYSHYAWTSDLSVMSHSWDSLYKAEVGIRKPNGNYRVEDLTETIRKLVSPGKEYNYDCRVVSISASSRVAVFCVTTGDKAKSRTIVTAFDVSASPPKLLWKRPGYLARDLERF